MERQSSQFTLLANDQQLVPYNLSLPILCNYIQEGSMPQHIAPHWHTDYELICVLEGNIEYSINGRSYQLNAGSGMIIAPGQLHSALLQGHFRYVILILSPEAWCGDATLRAKYLDPAIAAYRLLRSANSVDKQLMQCLSTLAALCKERTEGYELQVKLQLYTMLQLLSSTAPSAPAENPHALETLKQMLLHIQAHLCEPLSLRTIAASGAVSDATCCRLFRTYLKTSPIAYVTELRLQSALPMLMDPARSITEIAAACGFSGASYFTEQFRRFYGMPPRAFRAQMRQDTLHANPAE